MKPAPAQTPFSFFWPIIRPYKWWCLLMLQAPIISAFYPVVYNYSVKLLIDLFTQAQTLTYDQAFWPVFYFVVAQFSHDIAWRVRNIADSHARPYIRKEILHRSTAYLLGQPHRFFQNRLAGALVSKIKGISTGYNNISESITSGFCMTFVRMLSAAVCLAVSSPHMLWMMGAFLVIDIPFCIIFFGKLSRLRHKWADEDHKIFGFVADIITNVFTVAAFATGSRELKGIRNYYKQRYIPLQKAWIKMDFFYQLLAGLLYSAFFIGTFVYLIHLRNIGAVSVGDVVFVMSLTYVFADNVWFFSEHVNTFMRDWTDFRSAFSIMEIPQNSLDRSGALPLTVSQGEIRFKGVSFDYEKSKVVISKLNLDISGGQKVGLVGPSGAGKSTLVSLLLKNFALTSGAILIDGQNIADVTSDSLREQISLIPQDIMLFHRSIGENIGYAKPNATQMEIEHAAKLANIHDFISSLPQGYKTLVGERGLKLSGGQRQRIAIARAVLKNAPILILDEATSNLDSETESRIQESINRMLETSGATVIAIAHRLSTIRHMDRIVVMDSGRIVEDGTFDELIQYKNGKFKQLWDHQTDGMVV